MSDVQLAHALLQQFCRRVERMYGASIVTPNMHLHCHLRECLLDYGPVYNFWLFSFERYNGIFENFPSSTRSLEVQLMHRFLSDFFLSEFNVPEAFHSEFGKLRETILSPVVHGSLNTTLYGNPTNFSTIDWQFHYSDSNIDTPNSYRLSVFNEHHISELHSLFHFLYPKIPSIDIIITSSFRKYSSITYANTRYLSRDYKESHIDCFTLAQSCFKTSNPSIHHFFVHMSFQHNDRVYEHILVHIYLAKRTFREEVLRKSSGNVVERPL